MDLCSGDRTAEERRIVLPDLERRWTGFAARFPQPLLYAR
jgi:hypothetical protein